MEYLLDASVYFTVYPVQSSMGLKPDPPVNHRCDTDRELLTLTVSHRAIRESPVYLTACLWTVRGNRSTLEGIHTSKNRTHKLLVCVAI